jgi:hypothetical protein
MNVFRISDSFFCWLELIEANPITSRREVTIRISEKLCATLYHVQGVRKVKF